MSKQQAIEQYKRLIDEYDHVIDQPVWWEGSQQRLSDELARCADVFWKDELLKKEAQQYAERKYQQRIARLPA